MENLPNLEKSIAFAHRKKNITRVKILTFVGGLFSIHTLAAPPQETKVGRVRALINYQQLSTNYPLICTDWPTEAALITLSFVCVFALVEERADVLTKQRAKKGGERKKMIIALTRC